MLLTAIAAFNTIDRQAMTILGAPIKAEFHLTDSQVGLLGLVYGIIFAIGAAPLAALAERSSRRAVIAGCMALFSAATAMCGLATSFAMLLASRLGVGVGEAGTTAPSLSLIADSYPRERRTFALSIFSVASKPGGFIAFLAGGWIAVWLGWRATFLILGVPGLAIAASAWLFVREPLPGTSDGSAPVVRPAPATIRECLAYLRHVPSFWHVLIGNGLWSLFALGLVFWMPHYLTRSFGVSVGMIGTLLAFYTLFVGASGVLLVGWITQRLQRRDIRWVLRVLVIAALVAVPFLWLMLTTRSPLFAALSVLPVVFIYSANIGPSSAVTQALVPPRLRTVTVSLTQVVLGLLGLGLGSFLPGVLSDALKPRFGDLSLRYSLLCFSLLWIWAAVHFLLANRTLAADIARADAAADDALVPLPRLAGGSPYPGSEGS